MKKLATIGASSVAFLASAQAAFAQAPWTEDYCQIGGVATIQGFQCLISNVFNVFLTLLLFTAFAVLLYGAFKYLTSGGNTKGTETARTSITFAVVGIVVALSGFIILNLLAGFTGIDRLTRFVIPDSETTDFTNLGQ